MADSLRNGIQWLAQLSPLRSGLSVSPDPTPVSPAEASFQPLAERAGDRIRREIVRNSGCHALWQTDWGDGLGDLGKWVL